MANDTISRIKQECFELPIIFYGPTESQDVKQVKKNVAVLMQK